MFILPKQPGERLPCGVDFVKLLPAGETIQGGSTVTVKDSAGGDVTSAIKASHAVNGTQIAAVLQAGTAGQTYTVTFKAVTQNYVFEEEVVLEVSEEQAI